MGKEQYEVSREEYIHEEKSQDCPQSEVDQLDILGGETSQDEDQDSDNPDWKLFEELAEDKDDGDEETLCYQKFKFLVYHISGKKKLRAYCIYSTCTLV